MKGVVRTRVGYSGGTKKNPTYYNLGDHTETLQIDYDPTRISYEDLLKVFWRSHDPTARVWSRQYMAAIFFHNDEQKRLALKTRDEIQARAKGKVATQVIPFGRFYLAEDYHQKYSLRKDRELMKQFSTIYPDLKGFVDSTAAARLNGYLGGHGSAESLEAELKGLGLSEDASKGLLDAVKNRHKGFRLFQ